MTCVQHTVCACALQHRIGVAKTGRLYSVATELPARQTVHPESPLRYSMPRGLAWAFLTVCSAVHSARQVACCSLRAATTARARNVHASVTSACGAAINDSLSLAWLWIPLHPERSHPAPWWQPCDLCQELHAGQALIDVCATFGHIQTGSAACRDGRVGCRAASQLGGVQGTAAAA